MGGLELWFSNWKWSVKVRKPHWWHLRLSPPMNGGQKKLRLMPRTSFMRIAALPTIWLLSRGNLLWQCQWLPWYDWDPTTWMETSELMLVVEMLKLHSEPCGPAKGALSTLLKRYVCLVWTWSRNLCTVRQYTTYPYFHTHQINN